MADNFFKEVGDVIGDRTGLFDLKQGLLQGDPDRALAGLQTLRRGPRPYIDGDPFRDKFVESNSSYSGSDCVVIAQINDKLVILGNVSTFSYSIFREKSPVRTLGRSHAKGYTAGPRTIAGSMVFVVFDRNPLYKVLETLDYQSGAPNDRYSTPVPDQIPPIDLTLWFSNEYGHKSILRLYAVEFMQEGQTHSVNDLYTENVMQYVARDIDVLLNYRDIEGFRNLLYERQISGQFTDSHLAAMLEYKRKIERQIQETDQKIQEITIARGRQNIVTFGILGNVNRDLKRRYETELYRKDFYVDELKRINDAILYHQQNVYGYNPSQKAEATARFDNLKAANSTGGGLTPETGGVQPTFDRDSVRFVENYDTARSAAVEGGFIQ